MATYSTNVTEPLVLRNYVTLSEPVDVPNGAVAHTAINRLGNTPAADGDYVAGIVSQDIDASTHAVAPVASCGYELLKVAPGSAIALDEAVAIDTNGHAIPWQAGYYELGRSMDEAAATGTLAMPFYIRLKLKG